MSRIVNELDSIHFSIKKASKLVKEIGRQVCLSKTSTLLFLGFFFWPDLTVFFFYFDTQRLQLIVA